MKGGHRIKGNIGALVLGSLLVASAPGLAGAQTRGYVGFGGGVSIPVGDLKDAVKLGWLGQAMGGATFGEGIVGVRVNGTYGQNKSKVTGGGTGKFINAMGDVTVSPKMKGNAGVYLLAGAGILNSKDGASSTAFAWNAGGGVKVQTGGGNIGVYVEGRFLSARKSGVTSSMIPITAGIRITGK